MSGSGAKTERGDATGKIGQQQTAGQGQRNLRIDGRSVVLHSEEPETEGQKQRIAGKADQRGVQLAVTRREGIAACSSRFFAMSP